MSLQDKIALFSDKNNFVYRTHYMPELLSQDDLKDATLVDKDDVRLKKPETKDYEFAELYVYDKSPYWEIKFVKIVSIAKYKLKIQLKREGLLSQVEQMVQSNDETLIAWNDAAEISRNSNDLLGIAHELDLSEERVDEIFAEANLIEL